MSEDFVLNAEVRTEQGKGASRRLRRTGKVPMILYGGKDEPANLQVDEHEIRHHLEHEAFYSHIIQVKVDGGKAQRAVLKDVQRHPAKPIVLHIDMMRVVAGVKIKVTVPLHFIGEDEAPGVKQGGVVQHHYNDLEINVLPKNLPEYIEVDLSTMELDDSIHLSQVKLPEGVEVLGIHEGEDPSLASIHLPKVVEEPEEELEAAEEGAEGEEADTEGDAEAGDDEKKDEGDED